MHFVLAKKKPGRLAFSIIYGLIALLALIAGRFLPLRELAPSCLLKGLTGLPCPTCGSTRALVHLAHAEFFPAFLMNPLFSLVFLSAVLALVYGASSLVFDLPAVRISFSDREKDVLRIAAVLALLLNWLYLLFA